MRMFTTKVDLKLLSLLRKQTDTSILVAKSALLKTANNYDEALKLLNQPTDASKFKGKQTSEGLIGVYMHQLGVGASMIQLGCETDFVGRNKLFIGMLGDIAHTVTLKEAGSDGIKQSSLDKVLNMTLVTNATAKENEQEETVQQALDKLTVKLRENLNLKHVYVGGQTGCVVAAYAHGSGDIPRNFGRVGAIISLEYQAPNNAKLKVDSLSDLTKFASRIAQHCCGLEPTGIHELNTQDYLFGNGSVGEVVSEKAKEMGISLHIKDFKYLKC